ncbi:hypothetical protein L2E82_36096 [Cichorium intybus]|uniref:Uncharacterized protein n=1 Tax=Cichorium intybus TaxID=13427 RepID=A0ACB9BQL5_CICIN|nr:hypothetical protein L2E82_36096 [Cichorium intybus]
MLSGHLSAMGRISGIHYHKCRKEKWKSCERRRTPTSSNSYTLSSSLSPEEVSERRFGCMPFIQTNKKVHEDCNTVIGINLSINGWQSDVNPKNEQTYRGLPMMNEFIQNNITQCPEDTMFHLGNDLDLNQHDDIGSKSTRTTGNYFLHALSDPHDIGQGGLDHYIFSSIPRQTSDDFPDFLKDIDGNGPNDNLIA